MKKLSFSEIIKCLNPKKVVNNKEIFINGVSTDTRSLKFGNLFFALKGENFDGNCFIDNAEKNGASAAVCSKEITSNIPLVILDNTLDALQKLAAYYRKNLNIPIIAVTGSSGKTTTKNMIASVLSSKYKVFFTEKNYNNEIGLPRSILEIDDSLHDVAVLEMGMNHIGEIKVLSEIAKPDIAIITNIGKSHIGNLGSLENILKTKLEIISGLKKNGTIILNNDDNLLSSLFFKDYKTVFIGTKKNKKSSLLGDEITSNKDSIKFKAISKNSIVDCQLSFFGDHNVTNALIALICGLELGIELSEGSERLKHLSPSNMRSDTCSIKDIIIIKDYYNSNPESASSAIKNLAKYSKNGKKIAILGQMFELGAFSAKEHENLAKICEENYLDYVFFIGSDFQNFKNGLKKNQGKFFNESEKLPFILALFKFVNNELSKGDVILIKGSRAMKMEEIYEILKSYIDVLFEKSS